MSKNTVVPTLKKQESEKQFQFKKSIFFPWTNYELSFKQGQLHVMDRIYLLWTIPIGRKKDRSISLHHVAESIVKFRFSIGSILAFLFCSYFYIYMLSYSFAVDLRIGITSFILLIPFLIASFYFASKGFGYKLILIDHKQRLYKMFDVSYRQKEKLQVFADKLNKAIKKR